ncbi:MAG: curli-like amyloid fiber formation chaperone CsgH [Saprospiraceae bacterium]
MKKGWCTLLVLFALHTAVQSQSTTIEAWVKSYEEADYMVSFTGFAKNLTTTIEGLSFVMEISKADHNGKSRSTQKGTFTLEEDGVEALSTVRFNKVDNQVITIELLIFDRDQEVARASFESDASDLILTDVSAFKTPKRNVRQKASNEIIYPATPPKPEKATEELVEPITEKAKVVELPSGVVLTKTETQPDTSALILKKAEAVELPAEVVFKKEPTPLDSSSQIIKKLSALEIPVATGAEAKGEAVDQSSSVDDLEIDGLIINETRSKTGRDFYNFFYKKWQAPGGVKNFTITLKEYPTRGRVARVGIEVNGTLVFRPVLQPRQSVVEMSANQAIAIVKKHLLDQKRIKTQMESEDQSGSGLF